MKSVLLDHCVPRPFAKLLINCNVEGAFERGWARLTNGELLEAAEKAGIDVLITADRNLRYQQNLTARHIAIIELPTNRLRLIGKYAPRVNEFVQSIQPGHYEVIPL